MREIDSKVEVMRAAPAAAGLTIYNITLSEWVAIVTLMYLALQIFILVPKAANVVRNWRKHVEKPCDE